jgi:hypothetical protein
MSARSAVLVAVIASGRAVYEIADARVLVRRRDLLVRCVGVAVDTSEGGIVRGDLVAIVANRTVMRNREVGVLESGVQPAYRGVASVAGGRKSRGNMIRNQPPQSLRAVPGCLMAAVACGIRRSQRIVVVHMAIGAPLDRRTRRGGHLVRTRKRPTRGAMVKRAVGPGDSVVAGGAQGRRELCGNVVGHQPRESFCAIPVGSMAAIAIGIGAGQVVIVVDVTQNAGRRSMRAGERKARGVVIEFCTKPAIEVVAALTIRGCERGSGAGMRRIRGVLPFLEMAGIALRREAVENASGQLRVTLDALQRGVRAQKREAILVILHLLNSDIPALHGVTLRAVRAHLAAVNISVAIGAIPADIGEDRFDVALRAFHFFVHSAQGIAGLAVVELGNGADRSPAGRCVAVFTGNRERSVRIPRGLLLRNAGRVGGRRRGSRRRAGRGKGE